MRAQVEAFIARTGADELMITSNMFEHKARLRSYEIVSGLMAGERAEQKSEKRVGQPA